MQLASESQLQKDFETPILFGTSTYIGRIESIAVLGLFDALHILDSTIWTPHCAPFVGLLNRNGFQLI